MPSAPSRQAWANTTAPSAATCSLIRMPASLPSNNRTSAALRSRKGRSRRSSPLRSIRSNAYRMAVRALSRRRSSSNCARPSGPTDQIAKASSDSVRREEFDKLTQNVEKLGEDFGQAAHHHESIRDYIGNITADIRTGRKARTFFAVWALIIITIATASLLMLIFCPVGQKSLHLIEDSHTKIALFVALFGLSFGLMAILLKGSFQRAQQPEAPEILPGHIKAFIEAFKPEK
jgi:hypothetical protein